MPSILRVVLADEVVEVEGKDEAEWQTLLDSQQRADVAQLLDEYNERLIGSLGEGRSLKHVINRWRHQGHSTLIG